MVRTQIYLERDQKAHLNRLSLRTGRSQSELIRQAIDLLAEHHLTTNRNQILAKARAIWRERTDFPEVRELRDEFDRGTVVERD